LPVFQEFGDAGAFAPEDGFPPLAPEEDAAFPPAPCPVPSTAAFEALVEEALPFRISTWFGLEPSAESVTIYPAAPI
tara:strand:+ start:506 stop:736 length:231 start_codon:yes stop_codon:yes gene_type:complete